MDTTHACAICGHDCQTPDRNWIDGYGDRIWLCDFHWNNGDLHIQPCGPGARITIYKDHAVYRCVV